MWVVGTRKHHHCPVRWVKYQGKLAYVPMHPRDQPGKPPINLRHGIYRLTDNPNHPTERVAFNTKISPKLLDTTPKQFRSPAPPLLARAGSPHLDMHFMHESRSNTFGTPTRSAATSLTFDQHSNRFMLATSVTDGGRTHTFTAPLSDHGGHIAAASAGGYHPGYSGNSGFSHAGASSGAARSGGYSGGHPGGGFSGGGGHSGGGFSGGGGGHSGGGSSSGGGGGHH